ncbi:hypothetical protein [uncultured Helicobacter sp.]|uniref:hypothetical protein n=1 Tax=uncultured Helicobacter sp. TaxID=175537 RepID=UPI0037527F00
MLPHALFVFGKASHKFFEVVDCVSCLDSQATIESKEILNNAQRQNLNGTKPAQSTAQNLSDTQSAQSLDSQAQSQE